MPEHGTSLGNGFGNELSQFDSGLGVEATDGAPSTPTTSQIPLEEETTPQHRTRTQGSNRHSLAFELAAAMSPEQTTSNRLLEELGIEEEDEPDEDDEEVAEPVGDAPANNLHPPSPGRDHRQGPMMISPRRPATAKASAMSLRSVSTQSHTSATTDDSFDFDEADAAFASASSTLEDSISTTDLFLQHIREFNSSSSKSETMTGWADRNPLLERLAGDLIKRMQHLTKEREGQVRELQELDRALASQDLDILAELDDLVTNLEPLAVAAEGGGHHLNNVPEEDDWEPPTPTQPPISLDSWSSSSAAASAGLSAPTQLAQLRSITTQLVSTLVAIIEHAQLSRGATSEAGRKLRAIKGVITGWKGELESVERSMDYIRRWEDKESRSQAVDAHGERRKGRYAEMAFGVMREAERLLEDADVRYAFSNDRFFFGKSPCSPCTGSAHFQGESAVDHQRLMQ
jgi:hypothetical protein